MGYTDKTQNANALRLANNDINEALNLLENPTLF